MIAILAAVILASTPAEAHTKSGFCAAIIDGKAIITDAKTTPSREALEAEFGQLLTDSGRTATLSGCMVGSSIEIASGMMRAKALQISKEGYEITVIGW